MAEPSAGSLFSAPSWPPSSGLDRQFATRAVATKTVSIPGHPRIDTSSDEVCARYRAQKEQRPTGRQRPHYFLERKITTKHPPIRRDRKHRVVKVRASQHRKLRGYQRRLVRIMKTHHAVAIQSLQRTQ